MKLQLNLKDTFNRVWLLCILQSLFAVFGFWGESLAGRFVLNLTFVAQFALLIVTLNFHLRALKNLLNTFWSLTIILLLFYSVAFFRNALILDNSLTAIWYFFAILSLALAAWQISSPLYYPMVQWWEYDFRFRPDIRIWVELGDSGHKARLTDLRRGAGCVVMFSAIPIGSWINISTDVMSQKFGMKAQVVSRKEPILGRAFIYGVRFDSNDLEQRQRLKLLSNYWNESKKLKIRSKFDALQ
ncbi:MAG: PilZ domain-containing protein [Bacteriovoracaceae bacterium]|nr:PilZ domain-containing protein [Bacteriovoracaceae bacterium]